MMPDAKPFVGGLWALWVMATLRDFTLIVCGVLLIAATPASLLASDVSGFTANLWAGMLILGGAASILGSVAHRPAISAAGSFTLAGNFCLWAWAAARQPEMSPVSYAVVCVFVAFVFACVCNGLSRAMRLTGGVK